MRFRIAEAAASNAKKQDVHLTTIREIVNTARRMGQAVESSTAAIETESSKVRDDFAKGSDMADITEFVSEEAMVRCMGLVEERAKHAMRIFGDLLKTTAGRTAAAAILRRDAAVRAVAAGVSGASGASTGGPKNQSVDRLEPRSDSPSASDVARMLMESSMVS